MTKISIHSHHYRNIHMDKKNHIICEVCGKLCPSKSILTNHMKRHADIESQFHCEYCKNDGVTRAFPFKTNLKNHVERFHLKIKNFKCDQCPKSYYRMEELKSHQLQHQGIKFHCYVPGCTSAVTRKSVLMYHFEHNHELTPDEMKEYTERLNKYCEEIKCTR
jgi:KRAB domain-containing zinc finger protein